MAGGGQARNLEGSEGFHFVYMSYVALLQRLRHGRLFAQWLHHAYPRECRAEPAGVGVGDSVKLSVNYGPPRRDIGHELKISPHKSRRLSIWPPHVGTHCLHGNCGQPIGVYMVCLKWGDV